LVLTLIHCWSPFGLGFQHGDHHRNQRHSI